ncbi:hypothetical protein, partial [Aliivibrio sp. 1S175]|uniref:hypothetical protein n=1 Tax=Aliivibrio sp. 1S175 TaxID=1840087 RepID=UPI001C406019
TCYAGVVRTESEIFCTVHQKDRGFRSFGLVSVPFFFVAFWFSCYQVRQLSIVGLSSCVSEAILRFNGSLVLPHFSLHPCFLLSIFNPGCGKDILFISSKSVETKPFKWRKKCICFPFTSSRNLRTFCSLNWHR